MDRTILVILLIISLLLGSVPPLSVGDIISGPGGTNEYYRDHATNTGLLNFTDGETWTITIRDINVSQIAGNKILNFYVQDQCGYETLIPLQVQADFLGAGGHMLRSYDKGQVLKSSHSFGPGTVTGKFDLRVMIEDDGTNYYVTPQYRLPSGNWQTFFGGSWASANYELTNVTLFMQLDSGADGTVEYRGPTVYSNGIWYVDSRCKIQDSINEASSGNSIVVFGGTHNESLYINKPLTIRSAMTATIKGSGTYTSSYNGNPLSRKAVIFVVNCTYVSLQGLDVEGEGLSPGNNNGITFVYSAGEIRNCTISPNTVSDMSSRAIEARASNLTIAQNTIRCFGRTGVYIGNSTCQLSNNTIIGQVYTTMDKVSYGVEIDVVDGVYHQGPSIVQIDGNEISYCDNTFQSGPIYPSCAVLVDYQRRTNEENPSTVLIERNTFRNSYVALELVSNPQSKARLNSIINNRYGIIVDADYFGNNWTIDARCNWWGEATGPSHYSNPGGTGDTISDYVVYSPWLNNTFETTPRIYHVNPTGSIQEAIVCAETGDKVSVHSGTYDEQVVVDKSLTVQGLGTATIIKPSSAAKLSKVFDAPWSTTTKRIAPIVVANTSSGGSVQLENLRIDGSSIVTVPSGAEFVAGILYLETSGAIKSVNIANLIQTGSNYGSGIYIGSKINTVSLEVSGSTVTNFRRIGIEVSSGMSAGKMTVNIVNNTIVGRGKLGSGEPAQEGVRIADYAQGIVSRNWFSLLEHVGGLIASGILFVDANGTATSNMVSNAQRGLGVAVSRLGTWEVSFINNTVSNSSLECLNAQIQNAASLLILHVEENRFVQGTGDGISVGIPPDQSPAGVIVALIEDNIIDSWQNGVLLISSVGNGSTIFGTRITGNYDGVHIEQAVNAANIEADYNYIFGNAHYGIFNNATNFLSARNCWWGDPSGPTHPSNPEGKGDVVSDRVLFEPYLEDIPERPVIRVEPQFSMVAIDNLFDVNVSITSGVGNIQGWEFKLYYNNTVLECTSVVEGSFLKSFGATVFVKQVIDPYNSTHGRLLLACSLQGEVAASGNGTLAIATFKAKSRGTTPLVLADTKLVDTNLPPQRIPHTAISGSVYADVLVRVNPEYLTAAVGESFSVNVTIAGAANMYAWEFKMFYRNAILNTNASVASVTEGSFLKSFGATVFVKQVIDPYNSTHGRLLLACSLQGNASASGSGVLVTIRFKARNGGITGLDLVDTKLKDPSLPPVSIEHTPISGTVYIPGYYDVAVTSVTTSKTGCTPMPTVGIGYHVRADVTVQNQGDLTATFNVTLYVNSIGVATAIVANLLVGTSASCTLTWDTTGFSYGNYTITVKTSILPYEQDTADNTRSGGWVLATVPGDADGNHEVGILDVVKITMCYATSRGQTLYSPNSDLNDNDLINIQDLVICTGHYGQEWS